MLFVCICILQFSHSLYTQEDLSVEYINDELLDNANSVIRFQYTTIYFKSIDAIETHFSKAVTVLNKKAADELSLVVGYKESSAKVKDFKVEIYNAAGKLIEEFKKSEIKDQALYDGISMVNDYRGKTASYKAFEYPITIKYEYKILSQSTSGIRGFYPIQSYKQSVEKARFKLVNSTGVKIFTKENTMDGYPIERISDLDYRVKNLPALTKEKYAPQISSMVPSINFFPSEFSFETYEGKAKNWNELGAWYYNSFLANRMNLAESSAKSDLNSIISEDASPKEIVEQIYKFVQDNTRYINIALEEGGLRPMEAIDVHKLKYGDCKALSFYMQSLLQLYDIPSNYVLIEAGRSSKDSFDEEFFSLAQGNHVIVNVPLENDTIWLECTSGATPAGFLGGFTDGRKCLAINADGGRIVSTPNYNINENESHHDAELITDVDGNVILNITSTYKGLSIDNKLGLEDLNEDDFKDYLEDRRFPQLKNLKLIEKSLELQKQDLEYVERYQISSERFMEIAANYMIAKIAFADINIPKLPKDSNRKAPINFERSFRVVSEMNYQFPEGYKKKNIPENQSLSSEYGSYVLSFEQVDAQTVKVKKEFSLFEGQFDPDKYEEIKTFFDKVLRQENLELIFEKK